MKLSILPATSADL